MRRFAILGRLGFLAFVTLGFMGCGEGAIEDEGFEGDTFDLPPEGSVQSGTSDVTVPQVVYVDFTGPWIYGCPGTFCDDGVARRSSIIDGFTHIYNANGVPYVNFSAYGGTSANKTTIVNYLKNAFAAYNVTFTTTQPTSGDYQRVVISPSRIANQSTALRGRSYPDCGNANRRSLAFIVQIGNETPTWIGRYAAHELGHTFGLLHVTSTNDHMYYYHSSGTVFGNYKYDNAHNPNNGTWRCPGEEGKVYQDEPALLRAGVGPK